MSEQRGISGRVQRYQVARGPVRRAKYRLPDGRQAHKAIGPAYTGRGRPPAGMYTKRQAEERLRARLEQARAETLPGLVRTGVTFERAAEEYQPDEDQGPHRPARDLQAGQARAQAAAQPDGDVEKPEARIGRLALEVFSPEEIHALVRAATSEQDATIFLTAAFTGLRRDEIVALRWRDVDFARRRVRVVASYRLALREARRLVADRLDGTDVSRSRILRS